MSDLTPVVTSSSGFGTGVDCRFGSAALVAVVVWVVFKGAELIVVVMVVVVVVVVVVPGNTTRLTPGLAFRADAAPFLKYCATR